MSPFIGEFIGTALLLTLGGGVVANVILHQTKGNNSGWIVITLGWGMAVFTGVFASTHFGGKGHLNPAFTIAMAFFGDFDKAMVGPYVAAQFAGAMTGAVIVWLAYKQHLDKTTDKDAVLGVFCTSPAIRNPVYNMLTEIIGTFILAFGALSMSKSAQSLGALDALPVGFLVLAIGLSMGGPTGYAINPARDLGPRIMHMILPISGKRDSDWGYAFVPMLGPLIGACLGVAAYQALH